MHTVVFSSFMGTRHPNWSTHETTRRDETLYVSVSFVIMLCEVSLWFCCYIAPYITHFQHLQQLGMCRNIMKCFMESSNTYASKLESLSGISLFMFLIFYRVMFHAGNVSLLGSTFSSDSFPAGSALEIRRSAPWQCYYCTASSFVWMEKTPSASCTAGPPHSAQGFTKASY